jgi:hypothetical protein
MTMASHQEDIQGLRRRLVADLCSYERRVSLRTIEKAIRRRPEVLAATNACGDTLLHIACQRGAPSSMIQMLVDLGPEVAEMIDVYGQTPLHLACQNRRTSTETLSILIAAYPEALTTRAHFGNTPLNDACYYLRDSTAALQLLLAHTPSESLGVRRAGLTPLHLACIHGVSIDVIRQMICMYPRALRMFTNYRQTLLHLACSTFQGRHSFLAVICFLAEECPEACLVLDSENNSPYDNATQSERPAAHACEFMLEATRDAAIALLKCAFSSCGLITIPPAVLAHMKASLSNAVPSLNEESFRNMSGRLLVQSVRPHLNQATLKLLLQNSDLQDLLEDEDFQDLIRGLYRINKLVQNDGNKVQGVRVLESVSDTPVCMFLHLRNNPSLCQRDNVSASSSSDNEESCMPHQQDPGGPFESAELLSEATAPGSKRKAACLEL